MPTKYICSAALSSLLIFGAVAQPKPDPALDACWKAGTATAEKARADMKAAVASKKATPDDVLKFDTLEARNLKVHSANLASGYTLAKCQALAPMLAEVAALVRGISARPAIAPVPVKADSELVICRRSVGSALEGLQRQMDLLRRAGRVDMKESGSYVEIEKRILAALNKADLTLAACGTAKRDLEEAGALVRKMGDTPAGRDGPVVNCLAQLTREHSALLNRISRAKAERTDPKEVAEIAELDKRSKAHLSTIGKSGLTLPECEATISAIQSQVGYISKMLSTDPNPAVRIGACVTAKEKYLAANRDYLAQLQAQLKAAAPIQAKEAAVFAQLEQRAGAQSALLKKQGLTLAECEATDKTLNSERGLMTDTALASCRGSLGFLNKGVMDLLAQAKSARQIDEKEWAKIAETHNRNLATYRKMESQNGLTLQECQIAQRGLLDEKKLIAKMSVTSSSDPKPTPKADPALVACLDAQSAIKTKAEATFQAALTAKKATQVEINKFIALGREYGTAYNANRASGNTVQKCEALAPKLNEFASFAAGIAARPTPTASNPPKK